MTSYKRAKPVRAGSPKNDMSSDGMIRFNRIKPHTNALGSVLFVALALITVLPVVFVVVISFSSEASIAKVGYTFTPVAWSVSAYQYIFNAGSMIVKAFGNSILNTLIGTVLGLGFTATMGYALSRKTFFMRRFYTIYIFIPMLFQGGLVASYVVISQLYGLMNTRWALILPLACSSFYIIILRTFFTTTIPDSIIESGKMDGASQLRIFVQLVLPISLPAIATIGLFLTFAYWNDWYLALLYLRSTHPHMYPLQFVLVQIERSIDFLTRSAAYMSPSSSGELPSETMRMAIVVVIVFPIACSYPFFQRFFISGLTIGAVKG